MSATVQCLGKQLGDECQINTGYLAASYQRIGSCTELSPADSSQALTGSSTLVCIACKSDENVVDFGAFGYVGAWGVFLVGAASGTVLSTGICAVAWRVRRRMEEPFERRGPYKNIVDDDFEDFIEPEKLAPNRSASKGGKFGQRLVQKRSPSKPVGRVDVESGNRGVTGLRAAAEEKPLPGNPGERRAEIIRRKAENAASLIGRATQKSSQKVAAATNIGRNNPSAKPTTQSGDASNLGTSRKVQGGAQIAVGRRRSHSPSLLGKQANRGTGTAKARAGARRSKWDEMQTDMDADLHTSEAIALSQRRWTGGSGQQPLPDDPIPVCRPPQVA
jgi:hypothetical protein